MDWSSVATYHIVSTPGRDGNIEIQRKGRTTYVCERKKHVVGAAELRLNTPVVDGSSSVASAKLKPSYSECRVMLGDSSKASRKDWQSVKVQDTQHTQFGFSLDDRQYLWVKQLDEDAKDDVYAVKRLEDLQLVDAQDPETILATYSKNQSLEDKSLLGKFEALTEIGPELELLGLISILGLRECHSMQTHASKLPLNQGPPILVHGYGIEGIVGGSGR